MELSVFLAKAFGIYLLIVSLSLFINAAKLRAIIEDMTKNNALIFISGLIALIIGIPLVLLHNKWTTDWQVIITIIAWLCLIKGTLRVMCTSYCSTMMKWFISNQTAYYIMATISFGLGLGLSYIGFFT